MKGAIKLDNTQYIQDLLQIDELDLETESAPEQEDDLIEEKIVAENIQTAIRLDYKLKTCEERAELVNKIVDQTPQENLTARYLEILGDYIMGAISKEEKKSKMYLTDNRLVTVNKRETSFEGLVEKFENGEDGIYNLISNDKNMILSPKYTITEEDIETIPGLKALREEIAKIEAAEKAATGRKKYLLKKQLIEMRRDQYILKNSFKTTLLPSTCIKGINKIDLSERRWLDEKGEPQSSGLISFFNYKHISAILCNYSALKNEIESRSYSDFYYLIEDFDRLLKKVLQNNDQIYSDIIKLKIQGKTNLEIQKNLLDKYARTYTVEYLSALWRNKIPKLIAEQAKEDYLIWYYQTKKPNSWKTCSCCKQSKPMHNYFFSQNKTAKDGWYSLCKQCRNSKTRKEI